MTKHKNNYYLAASICLVAFVILGYTVKFYPDMIQGFDNQVQSAIRTPLSSGKTLFFKSMTFLGNSTTLIALVCVSSIFFLFKKYYSELCWLVGTTAVGGAVNYLIKFVYQRPRPQLEHLVEANHYSFPSGHAMASLIFYGSLIVIVHLVATRSWLKTSVSLVLGLLILLIGVSRVYVGVHYPTDILGGFLLGAALLLGSFPLFIKTRFIWRFKGKQS